MINIDEIENGIVLDHLPAGVGRKVLDLLEINENYEHRVALVVNVPSKKSGKKDLLKIECLEISSKHFDKVALIAPNATINIIKDSRVLSKTKIVLPKIIQDLGNCPNVFCITNSEPSASKRFDYLDNKYKCLYCEKSFNPSELVK